MVAQVRIATKIRSGSRRASPPTLSEARASTFARWATAGQVGGAGALPAGAFGEGGWLMEGINSSGN